jgi:hypothetical protein
VSTRLILEGRKPVGVQRIARDISRQLERTRAPRESEEVYRTRRDLTRCGPPNVSYRRDYQGERPAAALLGFQSPEEPAAAVRFVDEPDRERLVGTFDLGSRQA